MKTKNTKVVFKPYDQRIQPLIPPSWDDYISENHPVRTINKVIDTINLEKLEAAYQGGGRANYNPRMLLKLLVYGYLSNIYSSRKLESFANESIYCMWLTNLQRPDHNTINRFRSTRLKDTLKEIFTQIVKLLIDSGHVSLEDVYVDGTKIEANANKYTFVWGRSIKYNKERIGKQLEEMWGYAESVAKEEMRQNQPVDFKKVDPDMVTQTIATIEKALEGKKISQKVKQKVGYAKKRWNETLKKYEKQEEILGQRNSYSKTDPDATFMRMKEDHMLNGQLKPGYNLQISTNNQIVLDYSLHQKPTDTTTLPKHVSGIQQHYGKHPENLIADAGYGSEENYEYLEQHDIQPYVKYNTFDKDQKGKSKKVFPAESLYYNEAKDCYYCPMGQPMNFAGQRERRTENGYIRRSKLYRAVNCNGCPIRGVCHQGQGERVVEVNKKLNGYREKAAQLLKSEKGVALRKQRCVDVEPVFGNIKQNKGFKRFLLRGIEKVAVETGLVLLAHNIKKAVTYNYFSGVYASI